MEEENQVILDGLADLSKDVKKLEESQTVAAPVVWSINGVDVRGALTDVIARGGPIESLAEEVVLGVPFDAQESGRDE